MKEGETGGGGQVERMEGGRKKCDKKTDSHLKSRKEDEEKWC